MSIVTFFSDVGSSVFIFFRKLVTVSVTIFIIGITIYLGLALMARWRRNRNTSDEQNRLLVAGRVPAKRLRLRFLFTSEDNKKLVNIGRIVGFVQVKVKNDADEIKIYDIFITRKGFGEYRFYKVPPERHSRAFADVTLYDWNFTLDWENKYMVPNFAEAKMDKVHKSMYESGVDTIGLLAPAVHKAVQVNPIHRIQLRMTKMIKVPDESTQTMGEPLQQYLNQGGSP
jgi:hypothetical protein